MRVLLVSQHYWPETVGTARRIQLLGEYLAAQGHEVRVLCGWPNHPSMARHFHGEHDRSEEHAGVFIHRVPVYRAPLEVARTHHGPSTLPISRASNNRTSRPLTWLARAHRMSTYGTWLARGTLETLLPGKKWDIVVAVSPLPTGMVGAALALRLGVPFVFDLQDIWPEAAVQAGIFDDSSLVRGLEWVERRLYQQAAALVALSEGFARNLESKGATAHRVHVIPNAVDVAPHQQEDGVRLRREWGLSSRDTLVIYAGNMGIMQDLDVLLDAASGLRSTKGVHFLLVGEGIDKERLRRKAELEGLTQVRFMDPQPSARVPALLAAADVCFLSLRPEAYMAGTIPSKLYEYLAAARPIINLVEGDAAQTVDAAEAGVNLAPGDSIALRVAIFGLHADPALRRKMGAAGRKYVIREASIEVVGARYEALLLELTGESPARAAAPGSTPTPGETPGQSV